MKKIILALIGVCCFASCQYSEPKAAIKYKEVARVDYYFKDSLEKSLPFLNDTLANESAKDWKSLCERCKAMVTVFK